MHVAIVGAGITGLTAAWELLKKGHSVTILDKADHTGGLAAGFQEADWDWPLEHHYHHIFTSDTAIQRLAEEVGAETFFVTPKSSVMYHGSAYRFDGPMEILAYPHLSWPSKIRLSAGAAFLKLWPKWQLLDEMTTEEWIKKYMGTEAWKKIWEPLMVGKFGRHSSEVVATWFWARVHARSRSLGYFTGGFQGFVTALEKAIVEAGGVLALHEEIEDLYQSGSDWVLKTGTQTVTVDKVLIAAPSSVARAICGDLLQDWDYKAVPGLGAVTLVMSLDEPLFDNGTYWLNINERDWPFLAVVEHTNMIDKSHYNNENIVYVGNYLETNHAYFGKSANELVAEYLPALQRIKPELNEESVRRSWVFKAGYAQPIFKPGQGAQLPSMNLPLDNIYWCSMEHVYPWDRGTNFAVSWGTRVAQLINADSFRVNL